MLGKTFAAAATAAAAARRAHGRGLHFVAAAGQSLSALRLRDACRCPRCVDPLTSQKEFRTGDIPATIRAARSSADHGDGGLSVAWADDAPDYAAHSSHYSAAALADLGVSAAAAREALDRGRVFWDAKLMAARQHWVSFDDYLKPDDDSTAGTSSGGRRGLGGFGSFARALHRYGLAFIRGVPSSTDSVARIAERMGPLRNSFYGQTWDVRSVPGSANVAYTNKHLGFHMDLLYMREPPGFQLLHCLRNAAGERGGESLFSDAFRAVWALRLKNPDAWRALLEVPVRYGYDNAGEFYECWHRSIELVPAFQRATAGRSAAAANGDDPDLQPHHLAHVNYSPPFQLPWRPYTPAPGSDSVDADLLRYCAAAAALGAELDHPDAVFSLKLAPGDCVVFANRRVVHARSAFEMPAEADVQPSLGGNERWLRGAYVDEDALLSRFRMLRRVNPQAWDASDE